MVKLKNNKHSIAPFMFKTKHKNNPKGDQPKLYT